MRAKFINEKFMQDSDPIRDMRIPRFPKPKHHDNNLFIAVRDIEYVDTYNRNKKTFVPRGTVLMRIGGGCYGNKDGSIKIVNVSKINGKDTQGYYDLKNDDENYIEIYYDAWEKVIKITDKIENYFRNSKTIENAAKNLDISAVQKAIKDELRILQKIDNLLK